MVEIMHLTQDKQSAYHSALKARSSEYVSIRRINVEACAMSLERRIKQAERMSGKSISHPLPLEIVFLFLAVAGYILPLQDLMPFYVNLVVVGAAVGFGGLVL